MGYQAYVILGNLSYVIIFLLGLCLGSFLNSWIWRHHENIRVSRGRSICPTCRRRLKWYENIPVFSCLVLRGKCRTCDHKIPSHFFFVELLTACTLVFITWYQVDMLVFDYYEYLRNAIFVGFLVVIFVYDLLYKIIIPGIVWIGVVAGLFFNYLITEFSILNLLVAVIIGAGFFLAQYLISNGKWIGGGDVRLGVMMGIWLGWPNILVALMLAYISGAIVGVLLLVFKKKNLKQEVPFGTFLALATFVVLYVGEDIVNWYMGLIG